MLQNDLLGVSDSSILFKEVILLFAKKADESDRTDTMTSQMWQQNR
jgi:hypothetical protein